MNCSKMAAVAEELFRFQFSASTIELLSASTCSESHTNITLAFRLFDFPSVLLHLQRPPANTEALPVECPPKRSGVERWRVRGGKSCIFSMPSEQLKSLSETSQLYVMLTRLSSASSGRQDAGGGQLVAASAVSLRGLVETCLAEPAPVRHKHSVLLYRGSQLYAKTNVKLSLQRMQVTAEEGESGSVNLISDRVTGQSDRVQREVQTHQQAETRVVGPPAMLFRACRVKHQPIPKEGGIKTSLLDGDPVSTEGCSTTNTGHRTVWPNGYVEEVECDETMSAVDPLPTTHKTLTDIKSPLEDSKYPILQALLKELSVINSHSHEVQFQEHPPAVVPPRLSDKCLQTEDCIEVPSPTSNHMRHRVDKHTPQRPFVRTCCAMKRVPHDQETTAKKLTQTKPLQAPLQSLKPEAPLQSSKPEAFPSGSEHPPAATVRQVETDIFVQLPASVTAPPPGSAASKVDAPEKEGTTALPTEAPTTGRTKKALYELKQGDSNQGLSPVQEGAEGDSRNDSSGGKHVESRDDRSDRCVNSRGYRSDGHVDSGGHSSDQHDDRSDKHVDSRGHRSDRQVNNRDEKGHDIQGHSRADNTTAGAQCAKDHPSPRSIHSLDSNTSTGNTHMTKKHANVSESSDSAAESQKVRGANGGQQRNQPLQPPSVCSSELSRHGMSEEVRPTTGYSIDSLEGGRSVDTPTGFSSDLHNSYTEDFESGSNSSQDQNPVSNSDWNQDECPSPLPVGEERMDASISTSSISSSTSHTTDQ